MAEGGRAGGLGKGAGGEYLLEEVNSTSDPICDFDGIYDLLHRGLLVYMHLNKYV